MQPVHPIALFRLSVLGPLASRDRFERGELTRITRELATHHYDIPHANRSMISAKTIERWYHLWQQNGIEGLTPKQRSDRGKSKLPQSIQDFIISTRQDNPSRSIDTIKQYLQDQGIVAPGEVSRSTIHRVLRQQGLSGPQIPSNETERRSFEANTAGDLWYGDVMHGPKVMMDGRQRKVFLVSFMDDASRLITHSAFCLGETALDIEGVLKQAILKRGLVKKLVIDNGSAYRASSFQGICARLEIRVVYCRPFDPESKGKLERYHRYFRQNFLSELNQSVITNLQDLNARLWAFTDGVYHQRVHRSLDGLTPLQRFQQDLGKQRSLSELAYHLDELFLHRLKRKVRNDATISYNSQFYEVPYTLTGQSVMLVIDPHQQRPLKIESLDGETLGLITPLDVLANNHRHRHRPVSQVESSSKTVPPPERNVIEQTLKRQTDKLTKPTSAGSSQPQHKKPSGKPFHPKKSSEN